MTNFTCGNWVTEYLGRRAMQLNMSLLLVGDWWKKRKLNSDNIWKVWKKNKLNSDTIYTIWKKGELNSEMIWKNMEKK
jgi:hypothetical protein